MADCIDGASAYWLLFDAPRDAFFVRNENVEDFNVMRAIISETMLDNRSGKRISLVLPL